MASTYAALAAAFVGIVAVTLIGLQHQEIGRLREANRIMPLRAEASIDTQVSPGASLNSIAAGIAANPIDWRVVESEDYREYIANLRAIGCSEMTIHDIIASDVGRLFAERMIRLKPRHDYWRMPNHAAMARWDLDCQKLETEKRALLRELLGADDGPATELLPNMVLPSSQTDFEFLTPKHRAQVGQLSEHYEAQLLALRMRVQEGTLPARAFDMERANLDQWKEAALKNLLSSGELEEYQMRTDGVLVRTLECFEPTEEEFRKIFSIQRQFGSTEEERRLAGFDNKPPDPERDQKCRNALREALGEERYAEHQRTQNADYYNYYLIAKDYGLPVKETAARIYDLKQGAEARAAQVRNNAALSAAARGAALQAIRGEAEKAIGLGLSPEASRRYGEVTYWWLNNIVAEQEPR